MAAIEYGDLVVEEDSPVNPDLHFDSQLMHLYVMTERMVSWLDHPKLIYKSGRTKFVVLLNFINSGRPVVSFRTDTVRVQCLD